MARLDFKLDLRPWQRTLLRGAGYVAYALLVTMLSLFIAVPRSRIKDKLEATLSADPMSGQPLALGMETTIDNVGVTLFSGTGVTLNDILFKTRPTNPADKPVRFGIDDVTVKVGLLGLLFDRPAYRFRGHGFSGQVKGRIALSPAEETIVVEASGVTLTNQLWLQQLLGGIPLEGVVAGKVDLVAPMQLAANINGTIDVTISDAALGGNGSKLVVPNDPFLKNGLTLPHLSLGTIAIKATIEKGKVRLEQIHMKSPDGEFFFDGNLDLRDPPSLSQLHGYIRVKPSEALLKKEPTFELLTNTMGGSAKRPDGFLGVQLSGPLTALFPIPSPNPPPGVSLAGSAPLPTAPPPPPSVGDRPKGSLAGLPVVPSEPTSPVPPPPTPPPTPEPERDRDRERDPPPVMPPPNLGSVMARQREAAAGHGTATPPPTPPKEEGKEEE